MTIKSNKSREHCYTLLISLRWEIRQVSSWYPFVVGTLFLGRDQTASFVNFYTISNIDQVFWVVLTHKMNRTVGGFIDFWVTICGTGLDTDEFPLWGRLPTSGAFWLVSGSAVLWVANMKAHI